MKCDEFNRKWNKYLVASYGMDIEHSLVIAYLDAEFTKEVKINPSFNYRQIKLKFGTCRIYANSSKTSIWEKEVDRIVEATKG